MAPNGYTKPKYEYSTDNKTIIGLAEPPLAPARCSASPGEIAAKNEILNAITRLKTVAERCRHTMRGKEWTRREHDADIIDLEVIPALRRALWVMPNDKAEARGTATSANQKPL